MHRKPSDRKALGEVIRLLREEARLTQEALGSQCGLHASYLSDVERGRRNPTFETLDTILVSLNVSWKRFGKLLDAQQE